MSDNYLYLFPASPDYVPPVPGIREATELFRSLYMESLPHEYVESKVSDQVEIIHPVENFSTIHCHLCGAQLDEDWWYNQLDQRYNEARGFANDLKGQKERRAEQAGRDVARERVISRAASLFALFHDRELYPGLNWRWVEHMLGPPHHLESP